MPIDLEVALGAELDPIEFSWSSSDVQLYHLGLGAGADPMDPKELRYLTDNTPQVLPTFSSVAASFHMTEPPEVKFPGIEIELSKVLHASESVTVPAPLPPSGTARSVQKFTEIWDKGKAAVIVSEMTVTDPRRQAAVDHQAVHLRPRRGRFRRRAWPVDLGGRSRSRAGLRDLDSGVASAGAALPDVR